MYKDKNKIPKGLYCYSRDKNGKIQPCPYWSSRNDKSEQENGYCAFLEKGDWDLNLEAEVEQINPKTGERTIISMKGEETPIPMSLLWDMVKECGINDDIDFEEEA